MHANTAMNPTFLSPRTEKNLLVNGFKVDEIVEIYESLGYECKVNSELQGASGIKHSFDIIATKDSEVIVTDIVSFRSSILDTPASDAEVAERLQIAGIQIRAKAFDCGAYQCLIVFLSSYFSGGESYLKSEFDPFELFLKQNDIKVVQSANVRGASEKLRTLFGSVEANHSSTTA